MNLIIRIRIDPMQALKQIGKKIVQQLGITYSFDLIERPMYFLETGRESPPAGEENREPMDGSISSVCPMRWLWRPAKVVPVYMW